MKNILVTGATGNVGREVISYLKELPVKIYAAEYKKEVFEKYDKEFGKEVGFRKLDFYDPSTFDSCLKDIDRVFLMRPPQISKIRKHMEPFIKKMASQNIEHVVSLSIVGANLLTPHYRMEKKIEKYNLPYTHIRAGFFMQNLTTTHREVIEKERILCIPAGEGKTSFVDVKDIAEIAAYILSSGKYSNQILRITGKKALDYYEVAERMSKILEEEITYSNPSTQEFKNKMAKYGYSKKFLRVVSILYFTVKMGKGDAIYNDFKEVLSKDPRTIDQFIKRNKRLWKNTNGRIQEKLTRIKK